MKEKNINSFIVSDGIPTIEKAIEYLNSINKNQNLNLVSIRNKENLKKVIDLKNVNLINLVNIKKNDLLKLLNSTNIIIFTDDTHCPSTYRLLKLLKNNTITAQFIFLNHQGNPENESNLLKYIIYPTGLRKNNLFDTIKLLLKVSYLLISKFPVTFLSYPNCKVTLLSPDYKILPNLKFINSKPKYKRFKPIQKNTFSRIVYFFGKDIIILGKKGFDDVLEILKLILELNSQNTIYLKLHPNHSDSESLLKFKKNFNNGFTLKLIKNKLDFSNDLLLGSTTSAIYKYKCSSAINLYGLIKEYKACLINCVDMNSYFESNDKYFNYPKHIYHPKSLYELRNYFPNKKTKNHLRNEKEKI